MAITDWTSEGQDWATGFGGVPIRGKYPYPYIEALRLALIERLDVIQTVGEAFGAAIPDPLLLRVPITQNDGHFVSREWGFQWRDTMAWMRLYYLDPTDGLVDNVVPLVRWNNSTSPGGAADDAIFTHLGQDRLDTVFGAPMQGVFLTGEWARQQYDILNLLVWTMHTDSDGNTQVGAATPNTNSDQLRTGADSTFAGAVTAWNAASWNAVGTIAALGAHWAVKNSTGTTIRIDRYRMDSTYKVRLLPTTLSKTWHFIAHYDTPPSVIIPTTPATVTYQNNDDAIAVLNYNILSENAVANVDSETTTFTIGDFGTVTATEPAVDAANGWWIDPEDTFNTGARAYVVLKWDVAGGFAFIP